MKVAQCYYGMTCGKEEFEYNTLHNCTHLPQWVLVQQAKEMENLHAMFQLPQLAEAFQ
jgi:hypothetical protein